MKNKTKEMKFFSPRRLIDVVVCAILVVIVVGLKLSKDLVADIKVTVVGIKLLGVTSSSQTD